jgi:hypothetical protein
MDRNRILGLAVEELIKQRAEIDAEIDAIRTELNSAGIEAPKQARAAAKKVGRRRSRTPAERRAQAKRMRLYWAAKKLAAKPSAASKMQSIARANARKKSKAQKLALSLIMREVWKKRRAAAAEAAKAKQKAAKA